MVTSGVNYVILHFSVVLTTGGSLDIQQSNTANHEFGQNFSAVSRGPTPNGVDPHRMGIPTTEQIATKSHYQYPVWTLFQTRAWAGILGLRLPRQQGKNAVPVLPLGL